MNRAGDPALSFGQRLFAWLQLVRLPNAFTAVADVMMGFLITHGSLEPAAEFATLCGASLSLYWAGMVLNDVYDLEQDQQERPQRPIPSGRISHQSAQVVGYSLLLFGVLLAWLAAGLASTALPLAGVIGTCLALAIWTYDRFKQHAPWCAPVLIGVCRALNVLLGMSTVAVDKTIVSSMFGELAFCIGLYMAGITWFAMGEAKTIRRTNLVGGCHTVLVAFAILAWLPAGTDLRQSLVVAPQGWYLFWTITALLVLRRFVLAIVQPTPQRVQAAVKHAILTLIVMHAGIVLCLVGVFWGCAVLLLLGPAVLLGQWIYST